MKIATSFGGGAFSAELTWRVLKDISYRKHLDSLHQRLSLARDKTKKHLHDIGIQPWIIAQSGMYLWCTLPEYLDAADVTRKALA